MKKLNQISLILGLISFMLLNQSCQEEILSLQDRLAMETPIEIVNSGVAVEDLYGLEYQGGLIFYLNTDDGSGMVAAKSNQINTTWGCKGTDIPALNSVTSSPSNNETEVGARIGDGKANTATILAACSESMIAAKLCDNYVSDGKEGWFLPSRGELALMYLNLHLTGKASFPLKDFYASSTEYDADHVWGHAFEGGNRVYLDKNLDCCGGFYVRPVRSF